MCIVCYIIMGCYLVYLSTNTLLTVTKYSLFLLKFVSNVFTHIILIVKSYRILSHFYWTSPWYRYRERVAHYKCRPESNMTCYQRQTPRWIWDPGDTSASKSTSMLLLHHIYIVIVRALLGFNFEQRLVNNPTFIPAGVLHHCDTSNPLTATHK